MCLRIEVKSPEVTEKNGVSAKTGKPYSIREQTAYASVFDKDGKPAPYPVRISVQLEPNQPPYQPGAYQVDPRCIWVDRFGSLVLGRLKLQPVVQQTRAAA